MKTSVFKSISIKKLVISVFAFIILFSALVIPASASTLICGGVSCGIRTDFKTISSERYFKIYLSSYLNNTQDIGGVKRESKGFTTSGYQSLSYYYTPAYGKVWVKHNNSGAWYAIRRGSSVSDCGAW